MQIGRRIGIGGTAVQPAFGSFKVCAAKRLAVTTALVGPAPRQFAEPGVLTYPGKVGAQCGFKRR